VIIAAALRATELFDAVVGALVQQTVPEQRAEIDLKELGDDIFAGLLGADEVERVAGDDRRHLQTPEDRAKWSTAPAIFRPPIASKCRLMGNSSTHLRRAPPKVTTRQYYTNWFTGRRPRIVATMARSLPAECWINGRILVAWRSTSPDPESQRTTHFVKPSTVVCAQNVSTHHGSCRWRTPSIDSTNGGATTTTTDPIPRSAT